VRKELARRFGVTSRGRGLEEVVDDSFRLVISGAIIVVALTVALLAWLLLYSRPQITRYEVGVRGLQDSHAAMLNQSAGLRGFLTTGNEQFLEQFTTGRDAMSPANRSFLSLARDENLTSDVISVYVRQRVWRDGWAAAAQRDAARYRPGTPELNAFILVGLTDFNRYRAARDTALDGATQQLDALRSQQTTTLLGASTIAVVIGGLIFLAAQSRRRALRRDVLTPVQALVDGLESAASGDFDQEIESTGAAELMSVVDGFNAMALSLRESRALAEQREEHVHDQSARLRSILKMVREIGGSLNLKYVLESVVDGVSTVTSAQRVVVWLVSEHEATLLPAHDSDPEAQDATRSIELGAGVVGRAAKYGRTTTGTAAENEDAGHLAVPLIIGARVVGVLEMMLPGHDRLNDDQVEVLETLSIHAAAALEAARLHQTTSHASEHDALTRLANRRRLEADLALECDRSLRYARPLALIMLDLDHFKRLNDTYGHAKGDEVLQGVAETITNTLRSTDTAYRFGGEELVILARESDVPGAMGLADRVRGAIERRYSGASEGNLTASFGVAGIPENAVSAKALIAAADQALYTAKEQGRNQVVAAPRETFVTKEAMESLAGPPPGP
jgi:diguanylate cyclase (GGDEF)-like protein